MNVQFKFIYIIVTIPNDNFGFMENKERNINIWAKNTKKYNIG